MNFAGLRVLLLAVTLAVTALSAVGFFADRVQQALSVERAGAIAADLVVEGGEPLPQEWIREARERDLEASRLLSFPSVLFVNEKPQLVRIKAVEGNYPLRGNLRVRLAGGGNSNRPPAEHEAVAESRLVRQLGGGAEIKVGRARLRLAGELQEEPDLGANLFQLAPRLLIHWEDAQRSGLLGPASRASYRLLLAGSEGAIRDYRAWLSQRLPRGVQILGVEDGRPELNTAIDRARRFLSLAALCASLLAGVAIMLAARGFLERSLDEAAVLRTIGMTSNLLMRRYLGRLLALGLVSAVIGALLGWSVQQGLTHWFGGVLGEELPLPGWRPVPASFGYAALLLLGFAFPTLWSIRRVPPLRVLRRDLDPPGVSRFALVGLALGAWMLLVYWQLGELELATHVGVALIGIALLLAAIAGLGLWLLQQWRRRAALPIGVLGIVRQPGLVVLQLTGFGLSLSLLFLLALVRNDLVDAWQDSLPPRAPNHFLLNIQGAEVAPIRARLARADVQDSGFFPTTRARLTAINEQPVTPENYRETRARRLASREYSLGFGDSLQLDNRLLQGEWWLPGEEAFSVEEGVATALGIEVGDILHFDIAGQHVRASVRNLRSVEWDSFNVNFFVQGSAILLQRYGIPNASITSIYLDPDQEGLLGELSREFPGVSAISIGPLLEKVRGVIAKGGSAVEAVFLFTLAAALLVSVATLQLTRTQREREIALLRTLGGSRAQIRLALTVEFGGIGLIAGTIAMLMANGLGYWLGLRFFGLAPGLGPDAWVSGPLLGAVLLAGLAWLASGPLLSRPPLRALR